MVMPTSHKKTLLPTAAFAVVFASLAVWSCQPASGPDRTVRKFVKAMNDKDVNVVLTCVDPKQERMFRAAFRIVEKISGYRFPVEDLLDLLPGLNQLLGEQLQEDFSFSNMKILARSVSGDTARLTAAVTSVIKSQGTRRTQTDSVEFVLRQFEEEGWRIVEIRPATR
jgi:hypothetical protein